MNSFTSQETNPLIFPAADDSGEIPGEGYEGVSSILLVSLPNGATEPSPWYPGNQGKPWRPPEGATEPSLWYLPVAPRPLPPASPKTNPVHSRLFLPRQQYSNYNVFIDCRQIPVTVPAATGVPDDSYSPSIRHTITIRFKQTANYSPAIEAIIHYCNGILPERSPR